MNEDFKSLKKTKFRFFKIHDNFQSDFFVDVIS
jgi:hypothetical protein